MKENRIEEGRFTNKAHGLGTVAKAMVRRRAEEIAVINGRSRHEVLSIDLDQARHELTGEERLVPEPTPAEELLEEKRWEVVPESTGEKAPTLLPPDEQTFAEKLVEEASRTPSTSRWLKPPSRVCGAKNARKIGRLPGPCP